MLLKIKTIVKVLKRYSRGLETLAKCSDDESDKNRYLFDKQVFDETVRFFERKE